MLLGVAGVPVVGHEHGARLLSECVGEVQLQCGPASEANLAAVEQDSWIGLLSLALPLTALASIVVASALGWLTWRVRLPEATGESLPPSTAPTGNLSEGRTVEELCRTARERTWTTVRASRAVAGGAFLVTGDIGDMWIRDSAAQASVFLDNASFIDAVLRMQAFYTGLDPYANAFRNDYENASDAPRGRMGHTDKQLGRGGWVATRNF